MLKIRLHCVFFLMMLSTATWAQLTVYPLEQKPVVGKKAAARTHDVDPVSLPFWDDFSLATVNHAVDSLWINNNKVLVNNGQAVNPPTINVATFDGLNEYGEAYNSTDNLDFGYRDTLESQPIKMTEVDLPFRNDVFLTFFYQAGGYGEPPDPQDFLRLEFKDEDGVWDEILTLTVEEAINPEVFYDTIIRINQDEYYHDVFRFRFVSFGRKSGRYDAWHIDYVYLNLRDAFDMNTSISDRAMTKPFTSVLGDYFSIPYSHFISDPAANFSRPFIELNNLKDTIFSQVVSYTSYFKITNYTGSTSNVSYDGILDFEEGLEALPSLERATYQIVNLPDVSTFDTLADNADIFVKIGFDSGDNEEDYHSRYNPINFLLNDTLTHTFILTDFYAYDDGEAEYAAGLTTNGNQLAYQFDMKTTEQDTISDLSIYFPYFAGASATSMEFFIMDDENGVPGNILYEETITVSQTANNEFVEKIHLFEGVIVKDTFYIGYQEPASGKVRIGLDKSSNDRERLYFRQNSNATWSNDWIAGSLMIRPHFGEADIVTGIPEVVNPVSFYPNPNAGEFYVKGKVEQLHLFTITGQPVGFSVEDFREEKRINVTTVPSGLYIARYQSGGRVFTEKIIITR